MLFRFLDLLSPAQEKVRKDLEGSVANSLPHLHVGETSTDTKRRILAG